MNNLDIMRENMELRRSIRKERTNRPKRKVIDITATEVKIENEALIPFVGPSEVLANEDTVEN
jgi:hypothetical protein